MEKPKLFGQPNISFSAEFSGAGLWQVFHEWQWPVLQDPHFRSSRSIILLYLLSDSGDRLSGITDLF